MGSNLCNICPPVIMIMSYVHSKNMNREESFDQIIKLLLINRGVKYNQINIIFASFDKIAHTVSICD